MSTLFPVTAFALASALNADRAGVRRLTLRGLGYRDRATPRGTRSGRSR
jgi:hypothetical protein